MSGSIANPRRGRGADIERRSRAFAESYSIEATRPKAGEIEALHRILHPGTAVYLSAVPGHPPGEQVEAAARLRAAGLEPVPHIAARRFRSADSLRSILKRYREEAAVRRVLLIGGDADAPAGPFSSALDVMESGLLQKMLIPEVGIAGYPDGHPRIPAGDLERALAAKIAAAERMMLRVHIVTQFCFEAERIVNWLVALRARGVEVPVRIGMAGPAGLTALLNYARRCGVKASMRGLSMRSSALGQLMSERGPEPIITALLHMPAGTGDISPHFFSFGGIIRTAEYARAAADSGFASGRR